MNEYELEMAAARFAPMPDHEQIDVTDDDYREAARDIAAGVDDDAEVRPYFDEDGCLVSLSDGFTLAVARKEAEAVACERIAAASSPKQAPRGRLEELPRDVLRRMRGEKAASSTDATPDVSMPTPDFEAGFMRANERVAELEAEVAALRAQAASAAPRKMPPDVRAAIDGLSFLCDDAHSTWQVDQDAILVCKALEASYARGENDEIEAPLQSLGQEPAVQSKHISDEEILAFYSDADKRWFDEIAKLDAAKMTGPQYDEIACATRIAAFRALEAKHAAPPAGMLTDEEAWSAFYMMRDAFEAWQSERGPSEVQTRKRIADLFRESCAKHASAPVALHTAYDAKVVRKESNPVSAAPREMPPDVRELLDRAHKAYEYQHSAAFQSSYPYDLSDRLVFALRDALEAAYAMPREVPSLSDDEIIAMWDEAERIYSRESDLENAAFMAGRLKLKEAKSFKEKDRESKIEAYRAKHAVPSAGMLTDPEEHSDISTAICAADGDPHAGFFCDLAKQISRYVQRCSVKEFHTEWLRGLGQTLFNAAQNIESEQTRSKLLGAASGSGDAR